MAVLAINTPIIKSRFSCLFTIYQMICKFSKHCSNLKTKRFNVNSLAIIFRQNTHYCAFKRIDIDSLDKVCQKLRRENLKYSYSFIFFRNQ
jgi:hypothetical protein